MMFTLYMGRAKLNLLIAQFGKCKDDCLEALKIKEEDEQMWIVLCRSRYFVEKYQEGLDYVKKGLEKCPKSEKLKNLAVMFLQSLENEKQIANDVSTF